MPGGGPHHLGPIRTTFKPEMGTGRRFARGVSTRSGLSLRRDTTGDSVEVGPASPWDLGLRDQFLVQLEEGHCDLDGVEVVPLALSYGSALSPWPRD